MRYISYAQEYEDIILFSALRKYVVEGVYVDIGAYDPCVISVTKFFYDMGWRGMNIEPLETEYNLLCEERTEDENINVGVSDKEGELELSIAGTGSSFRYTDMSSEKIIKPVKRFADIFRESRFFEKEIHFCKIDVEGLEKDVLNGIDFAEFRPWLFVMESTLPGTNIACYSEWEDILTANGYSCELAQGINRYYVRQDKDCLIEGLINFRKMFWDNTIIKAEYDRTQSTIRDALDRAQQIAVFGAGEYMHNFFKYYGEKYNPCVIVDNAKGKWGTEMYGIKVQDPNVLRGRENLLVLICCAHTDEIKEQLNEMGIRNYIEYHYM